jgi:hypothetical protein
MEPTNGSRPELKAWAAKAVEEAKVWTHEASSPGRRAWHEGTVAALLAAAGDAAAAVAKLETIIVDYQGAQRRHALDGYAFAVAEVRGIARYLRMVGETNVDAWAEEDAAADATP